jgi:hypothetical protein
MLFAEGKNGPFAVLRRIPVPGSPGGPGDFIDIDRPCLHGAGKHRFYADATAEHLPKVRVRAGRNLYAERGPGFQFVFFDDADDHEACAR